MEVKFSNQLKNSSSTYLLQHAHNPVNWVEWSKEAFAQAKAANKLVIVSIGYASCHWCHVMEKECFEDVEVADVMNQHFVCIKVDREERPDVDQIYMDAIQLLNGNGGWPLNVITLPDGRPLHGGTYFPKNSWINLLQSIASFYNNNQEQAIDYADELTKGVVKNAIPDLPKEETEIKAEQINASIQKLYGLIDLQLGGFNWAPKFPMPSVWNMFLHASYSANHKPLLEAVNVTLNAMSHGGLFDHVTGGFARYSVDSFWKVPHFEKMLYDNAQLISLFAQAYLQTNNTWYAFVLEKSFAFMQTDMLHKEGYFFSAIDADSEGEEGTYYVWTSREITAILGVDAEIFMTCFNVSLEGNWEHEKNVLNLKPITPELLVQVGYNSQEKLQNDIQIWLGKLKQARQKRIPPITDTKMVTAWNALMVSACVDAFKATGNTIYINQATTTANFLLQNVWKSPTLHRIFTNGVSSTPGFADDYAQMAKCLIQLFAATGAEKYLHYAQDILASAITYFYDENIGLFRYKSIADEPLIATKFDTSDDVIASSNSVLAEALYVMAFLTGNTYYEKIALRQLSVMQTKITNNPFSASNWINLALLQKDGLVIGYKTNVGASMQPFYAPNLLEVNLSQPSYQSAYLQEKLNANAFFICTGHTCGLPIKTEGEYLQRLAEELGYSETQFKSN